MATEATRPITKRKARKGVLKRAARRTAAQPHPRSSVDRSPFIDEIRELFDSSWGAAAINRWLRMRYADNAGLVAAVPSVDALQRWRQKNVKPCNVLPTSILHKMIGKAEAAVDVLSYLEALTPLLANRVGRAMQLEETMGGLAIDAVDKAAATFLSAAKALWEAGQDVGLYPNKPVSPSLLLGVPLAGDADVGLSDGEQSAMWQAIWRHRNGTELPEIESPLAKEARLGSETAEGESN
jgi:hypothetical protein